MPSKYKKHILLVLSFYSFQNVEAAKIGPIDINVDIDEICKVIVDNPKASICAVICTAWLLDSALSKRKNETYRDNFLCRPEYSNVKDDIHQLKRASIALGNIGFNLHRWARELGYRRSISARFMEELNHQGVMLESSEYDRREPLRFTFSRTNFLNEIYEEENLLNRQSLDLVDRQIENSPLYVFNDYPYENSMHTVKHVLRSFNMNTEDPRLQAYVSCRILLRVAQIAQDLLN